MISMVLASTATPYYNAILNLLQNLGFEKLLGLEVYTEKHVIVTVLIYTSHKQNKQHEAKKIEKELSHQN